MFKGTVSVIPSDSQYKDGNDWFTKVPLKLINNLEDIVVFLGFKKSLVLIISKCFPAVECGSYICTETTIENNQFLKI